MTGAEYAIGTFGLRILLWVFFGMVSGFLLAQKGHSPVVGILLGIICGPVGLIIGLIVPSTGEALVDRKERQRLASELREARENKECPNCGCVHSVVNPFCPQCMHDYSKPFEHDVLVNAEAWEEAHDSPRTVTAAASSESPAPRPREIQQCHNCGMRVIPNSAGMCPSCRSARLKL